MIRNTKYIILIFCLSYFLLGCSKIGEYYLGLNMEPNMENSPPLTGLNVFGILKTGADFDTINHFFEVQQMISLSDTSIYFDEEANIQLIRTTVTGIKTLYNPDYYGDALYFDQSIETAPGDIWEYRCVMDTFDVFSTCVIPNTPKVINGVQNSEGTYRFNVKADETAFMYGVYLLNGDQFYVENKIPSTVNNTAFSITPDWEDTEGNTTFIYVFAYDKNIREYNTTSNTLFKPNAYRPAFSTVEGGYGTFGAVSSCLEVVK